MFAKSLCLAAAGASVVSGFALPNFGQLAVDSGLALSGLNTVAVINALSNTKGTCNLSNIKYRQEWYVFPSAIQEAHTKLETGGPFQLPSERTTSQPPNV